MRISLHLCNGVVEERSSGGEVRPGGLVERGEVRMLEEVTLRQVRILSVERTRFPGQRLSSQG